MSFRPYTDDKREMDAERPSEETPILQGTRTGNALASRGEDGLMAPGRVAFSSRTEPANQSAQILPWQKRNDTQTVPGKTKLWCHRPLRPRYAIVFFDSVRLRIKEGGRPRRKSVHVALGVAPNGAKEGLGLWIEEEQAAPEFRRGMISDLKARGISDIFVIVGPEASSIRGAACVLVPRARVVLSAGHFIRQAVEEIPKARREPFLSMLERFFSAETLDKARTVVRDFASMGSDATYKSVATACWENWDEVVELFRLPPGVRRMVNATSAIQSVNAKLQRCSKKLRCHFPDRQSAIASLSSSLELASEDWRVSHKNWKPVYAEIIDSWVRRRVDEF